MNTRRILLIDDDVDDQLIFTDMINEITTGVECIIAGNGVVGLRLLKSGAPIPSLIFLDLNMPLMNGFDCLKHIKEDEKLRNIPVIIFTTSDNPADKKRTREQGAEMFLTKTPDFKKLKSKLSEILSTDFSTGTQDRT